MDGHQSEDRSGAETRSDRTHQSEDRSATPARAEPVQFGAVTVMFGEQSGKYPHGNSFLVSGPDQTLLVDCSLTVRERASRGDLPPIDQIVISHAHEDHLAGLASLPGKPVWVHEADRIGVESLDGLLQVFGYTGEVAANWGEQLRSEFTIAEHRSDVHAFVDGHRFDLGGGRTATVVHLPGHTRGHCGLMIEPDGFCYVADVDLTGFGPYYGDAWSDLDSFVASIERCAQIDARWYLTYHQKGLVEGAAAFQAQLATFAEVIERRDETLLRFFAEPHTLDDLAHQRFVYRPHVEGVFIEAVERRMGSMHLDRLMAQGRLTELDPGRYRAA